VSVIKREWKVRPRKLTRRGTRRQLRERKKERHAERGQLHLGKKDLTCLQDTGQKKKKKKKEREDKGAKESAPFKGVGPGGGERWGADGDTHRKSPAYWGSGTSAYHMKTSKGEPHPSDHSIIVQTARGIQEKIPNKGENRRECITGVINREEEGKSQRRAKKKAKHTDPTKKKHTGTCPLKNAPEKRKKNEGLNCVFALERASQNPRPLMVS